MEVRMEPKTTQKKQPSLRDRRRMRSMAVMAKKTPRKEGWMLFREGNWTKP